MYQKYEHEYEIRKKICQIGQRIYDRRMVAANDGNISFKINDHEFLCTPTGISKGFMTPESICRIDENGNVLDAAGGFKPSSEIKMHLRVYEKRPDVRAVVHAHPIYATTFAAANTPLAEPILSEAVVSLGCVPVAEYGTPSTVEIPDSIEKYLPFYDAILLENHGALTWSSDLESAYLKMESTEFYAELMYRSKVLGSPRRFTEEEIKKLYEVRRKSNMPGRHPATFKPDPECTTDYRKLPGYQYDFVPFEE